MRRLIYFEFYKILKRKDSWIIYLMLLIPLLYSVGFSNGANNITFNGKINSLSAFDFADDMFVFGYYILVFLLSVGFIIVNSFRGEIDSGSITLLINKVCNKKKIYLSKVIAIVLFLLAFALVFIVFSILCYVIFLNNTSIASGKLLGGNYKADIIRIFSILLLYIWGALLAGLLSSKLKIFTSMGVFTVIWAMFMYLNEFEKVNFLSPIYHLKNVIEYTTLSSFIVYFSTITISGFLMFLLTINIFERCDFS